MSTNQALANIELGSLENDLAEGVNEHIREGVADGIEGTRTSRFSAAEKREASASAVMEQMLNGSANVIANLTARRDAALDTMREELAKYTLETQQSITALDAQQATALAIAKTAGEQAADMREALQMHIDSANAEILSEREGFDRMIQAQRDMVAKIS